MWNMGGIITIFAELKMEKSFQMRKMYRLINIWRLRNSKVRDVMERQVSSAGYAGACSIGKSESIYDISKKEIKTASHHFQE